ncbi:hypothetical protein U9K52_17400 [Chryseobacterium sp. MHB01]|uniref:hypothetical protein n=1 Tax=Chryseobacterium sp. MHB01 TaxID=3109433 RepID=UPI002AFF205F|nr:hypothetical protein [Chryseobacterium sp. MHB01]MEA1850691.1 hypothetical protein [Chryseobacterium sp. MHB01]
MKKFLFAAVLVAGTTLGFAKDNVQSTNILKVDKNLSLEKVTPSVDKKIISVKKICGQLVYTEEQHSYYDMQTNTIITETVGTYTHYTYWC